MATRTLHVEVVTAESEIYSGEANEVVAPGSEGQLGILPEHAALLALLKEGALRIKTDEGEEPIFISGGFLEVSNDQLTVLATTAEHADEIDVARAEEARRRAQERLQNRTEAVDRARAHAALQRAISRIKVAELTRRRRNRSEMPVNR